MTSDFDELASAYLDGQTTEAETARVEADTELTARAQEFGAVSEALSVDVPPPDEFLERRQIGAALDAFDALDHSSPDADHSSAGADAPVDLGQRRAHRDRRSSGRGGVPGWLTAAAVLLLIVGGVGLLTQLDGSDDADTVASEFVEDSATEAGAAAEEPASDGEARTEATEAAAAASREGADDADQSFAVEADQAADAEAAEEESAEGASEDEAAVTTTATSSAATSSGGFFPEEQLEAARASFDEVPGEAELLDLADGPRFDPALSDCAAELEADDGLEVRFLVPVTIAGVDGETLFAGTDADPIVIVVDTACVPFG